MTKRMATGLAVCWVAALLMSAGCGDGAAPAGDGGATTDLGPHDSGDPEDASRNDFGTQPDLGPVLVDSGPPPVDEGPPGCASDGNCDDAIDCTTDTCDIATGACRHIVTPALCGPGESCNPTSGCEGGRACGTDLDCADTDACTTMERCDPASRTCTYQPLDGDGDGDPPRVCHGTDCDDSRANVYGGAPERCDSLDNDCDGVIDEGATAACGAFEVCLSGACVCAPGAETCGGWTCHDLATDAANCGECASSCGAGTCGASTCNCRAGLTSCRDTTGGSFCTDATVDRQNCGTCGTVCVGADVCIAGVCRSCGGHAEPCCGGTSCNATLTCTSAECRCPTGLTPCGSSCVDMQADREHCGGCDVRCTNIDGGVTYSGCVLGACVVSCGGYREPCCMPGSTCRSSGMSCDWRGICDWSPDLGPAGRLADGGPLDFGPARDSGVDAF